MSIAAISFTSLPSKVGALDNEGTATLGSAGFVESGQIPGTTVISVLGTNFTAGDYGSALVDVTVGGIAFTAQLYGYASSTTHFYGVLDFNPSN
jgi:hypothetical protein